VAVTIAVIVWAAQTAQPAVKSLAPIREAGTVPTALEPSVMVIESRVPCDIVQTPTYGAC
jgi:hypothetical protein